MRIFGFDLTLKRAPAGLQTVSGNAGWWPLVREPFPGAWQKNHEVGTETILTFHAVQSCVSLISGDISKLRIKLVEQDDDGIWNETDSPSFTPVLTKPNRYQNRIQFLEGWVISKLIHGNTYVLKERDERSVVVRLHILDPKRVKVLVAPDGDVFYELQKDLLAGVDDVVTVPASEIIHDRMDALYHPLVGVSPVQSCALAVTQGLRIQENSSNLFANGSQPGGILTAPDKIGTEAAQRIKEHWEKNFTGANIGRVAVLGDGLKYETIAMKATDAQLIEQLKLTAEMVCSSFHVPGYMVNVGPLPAHNNIEALNQQYYQQCLQKLIECIELCLDEGLGLVNVKGKTYGTELDLDGLLRMDTATQIKSLAEAVIGGLLAPNEARKILGYGPTPGGDSPMTQQQNFSLAALNKRDSKDDPFAPAPNPDPPPDPDPGPTELTDDEKAAFGRQVKAFLRERAVTASRLH